MTSKQRAYLKGLAMTMDPILQLGKGGLTPENTAAVEEDFVEIADIIATVVKNPEDEAVKSACAERVKKLCEKYPLYQDL